MFRKFIITLAVIFGISGVALASVNILDNGTNLGPAQDINIQGASITNNGPTKIVNIKSISGDTTVTGSLTTDGTLYTAKITSDGAIYLGRATLDPCGTLGAGYVFFNDSTGEPCYCDNNHDDLKFEDGSTACF